MDNEASTSFKMTMANMDIKYQLVPIINQRAKMHKDPCRNLKNTS